MASAKEYFKRRQSEMYSREYQQNLRRHHQKVLGIAIGSAVLIIGACIALYFYNISRVYTEYSVVSELERDKNESIQYVLMNDMLLCYGMDGITCYDRDYKLMWNQSYEMKKPMIDVCESYAALCDQNGTKCYIFSEDGLKGEVDVQLPIERIEVANQGVVAVLVEDGDVNRINYYDRLGTLLAENKAPIEKSGYPMDISLSNDGMKMAVSYMTLETGSINTKVAFYNFDTVGANEIDHLVSAQEYDGAVVPEIEFVNATTAVAFGDQFFDIFQGSEKPVERYKKDIVQEIKSVFYSETYIGIVTEYEGNEPYLLQVYDLTGKEMMFFPFQMSYEEIKIQNDNIYIVTDTQCLIYNFKGNLKYKGDFKENLQEVLPLETDRMIIVLDETIQTIKLK